MVLPSFFFSSCLSRAFSCSWEKLNLSWLNKGMNEKWLIIWCMSMTSTRNLITRRCFGKQVAINIIYQFGTGSPMSDGENNDSEIIKDNHAWSPLQEGLTVRLLLPFIALRFYEIISVITKWKWHQKKQSYNHKSQWVAKESTKYTQEAFFLRFWISASMGIRDRCYQNSSRILRKTRSASVHPSIRPFVFHVV